ncbi:MAG: cytochrome c oxidase assembly protein [Gemmatimonadaceae bacterium]
MQFWCSASNNAWTWTWKAYPGVWLFVVLIAAGAWQWNRSAAARSGIASGPIHPFLILGLVTLWLALDWPVGALGAGYLASIHMLQFLLIALVAPPLLLRGLSAQAVAGGNGTSRVGTLLRRLVEPPLAAIVFNIVVLITHLPTVVDALMPSQLGSMLIDVLWLAAGIIFWWPVLFPELSRKRFPPPLRMLYIMVGLMFSPIMFGLAGFLAYSDTPMYGLYELAPPLPGLSSKDDHQTAGALMSVGGAFIAFIAISVIFFKWSRTEA